MMFDDEEVLVRLEMAERQDEMERAAAQEVLRDQFAMAALTGLLARRPKENGVEREAVQDAWSRTAYEYADAMLAARGGEA